MLKIIYFMQINDKIQESIFLNVRVNCSSPLAITVSIQTK